MAGQILFHTSRIRKREGVTRLQIFYYGHVGRGEKFVVGNSHVKFTIRTEESRDRNTNLL